MKKFLDLTEACFVEINLTIRGFVAVVYDEATDCDYHFKVQITDDSTPEEVMEWLEDNNPSSIYVLDFGKYCSGEDTYGV